MYPEPSTVRAIVREIDRDDALVEVEQGGCGYSASAIRERIYCGPSKPDPSTAMSPRSLNRSW